MAGRAGTIDAQAALAMLEAFASVGAAMFDITLLDSEGCEQGFQRNRSLEELRRSIGHRLEAATERQHSIVIGAIASWASRWRRPMRGAWAWASSAAGVNDPTPIFAMQYI